jgi:hypothetical protein
MRKVTASRDAEVICFFIAIPIAQIITRRPQEMLK